MKWNDHIERVRAKVGRLVGVLGRASQVLGGQLTHMLYNSLVLPHLQYCLTVWGDLEEGRNQTLGESLLKYQKRLVGMIAEQRGRYHADPLFAKYSILKVQDLYRQQLRILGWQFYNGLLPASQTAIFNKTSDVHSYSTRSAEKGIYFSSKDHRSIGYRVPKEWESIVKGTKEARSLNSFKRLSKDEFIKSYGLFNCSVGNCFVCVGS